MRDSEDGDNADHARAPSYERVGAVVMDEVEDVVLASISEYVERGASVSQAVDMYATTYAGYEAAEWARATDRQPSSVRQSTSRGWDSVGESEEEGDEREGDGRQARPKFSEHAEGEDYDYYSCPSCGASVCTLCDCPSCGWYDEDMWREAIREAVRREAIREAVQLPKREK